MRRLRPRYKGASLGVLATVSVNVTQRAGSTSIAMQSAPFRCAKVLIVTLIFMTLSGRDARMGLRAVARTAVRLSHAASQAYAMRPATRRHEAGAKFPLSRAAPEP